MLQREKSFAPRKILLITIIATSMAACSGTETTSSPTDSASSPSASPSLASPANSPSASPSLASPSGSPSPQATASSVSAPIPNVKQIKFKAVDKNSLSGYFGVNSSNAPKIQVPKASPITASGWAVIPGKGPADRVIITYGNNNTFLTDTPVNLPRPDVSQYLKNPAYENSGWSVTFNSSLLHTSPVVLKAWAYDATTKQATQLNLTHEIDSSK